MTDRDSDDRTVIRPRPGGGIPTPGAGGATPPPPPSPPGGAPRPPSGGGPDAAEMRVDAIATGFRNPLVRAAVPLLVLAGQLRHTLEHPDPEGLRRRVIQEVSDFEARAARAGLPAQRVLPARYVLCAFIDEAVLSTPWGTQSTWSSQGMLITFHKEAWGGEKFFTLLEQLLASPAQNRDLLELMYVILALGFEGRYHTQPNGQSALEALRRELYLTLRQTTGEPPRELSPHWQGLHQPDRRLSRATILWATAAGATAFLVLTYLTLTLLLNSASDPVYGTFHRIDQQLAGMMPEPPPVEAAPAPAPEPERPSLRKLLADQIAAGKLDVIEEKDRSRIILFGDGMFPSGSTVIRRDYLPVLSAVARALAQFPGRVLVTGHTDNVPIRSLRFPSNWHLSQARADAVADFLARQTGDASRFVAEGRADTEPLVPNDSPANRARNRRVEILVYHPIRSMLESPVMDDEVSP